MPTLHERLADLLIEPQEAPEFEIKNWLDLENSQDDRATFAKAVLALANHGGGYIALGLTEANGRFVEAPGRPVTLDAYSQDQINGIARSYCDPSFHCVVHVVRSPQGGWFPIVVVPGGHKVPVRARRAGPNGNTVSLNAIYMRKPGPRSEMPQTAQDWDELLARCLQNRRDEMFDQIRALISGVSPQAETPPGPDRLEEWRVTCRARWQTLIDPLPANVGPRMPRGRYFFAYAIEGERRNVSLAQLRDLLMSSVVRHTGWPPFWFPTRTEIAPYFVNNVVECWLGRNYGAPGVFEDAAHSDFWCIHPEGLAYLLRGYQEDGFEQGERGVSPIVPGTTFDITLPIWRVGEALLHAKSLASNLFSGPATVTFVAGYEGLSGRSLASIGNTRDVRSGRTARQDAITMKTRVDSQSIEPNLPEIVRPLLADLYALFDFFELPASLVTEELARMRAGSF